MKKIFSLILIFVLLFSLGVPSLAEDAEVEKELVELETVTKGDYEAGKVQSGTFHYQNTQNGMSIVEHENTDEDSQNKYYLSVERKQDGNAAVMYVPTSSNGARDKVGIFQYEFDIMVPGTGFWSQGFGVKLYWDKEKTNVGWASGVASYGFNSNGEITFNGKVVSDEAMENNRWYNFKLLFDPGNSECSFFLDGVRIHKEVTSKPFYAFGYLEMYVHAKGKTFCIDNPKASMWAYKYTSDVAAVDADGNTLSDGIDYRTPRIAVNFTEKVSETAENISSDNIKLKIGEVEIESDLSVSEDGKTVFVAPRDSLIPSTEYTVEISNGFKSFHGLARDESTVHNITTCKPAFSISNVSVEGVSGGAVFSANATISNKDAINANALLLVAAYDAEGYLISIGAANVLGSEHGTIYSVELKTPENIEGGKVKAYLLNSFLDQTLIDEFELSL